VQQSHVTFFFRFFFLSFFFATARLSEDFIPPGTGRAAMVPGVLGTVKTGSSADCEALNRDREGDLWFRGRIPIAE
jgi:hypothetical protein